MLGDATVEEIRDVAAEIWPLPDSRRVSRDRGLRRLLAHLDAFAGRTWQQRWEASGLNQRGRAAREVSDSVAWRAELTQAVEALFALRIVQPSLEAFRANHFMDYPRAFRIAQADEQLNAFFTAVEAVDASRHWRRRAVFDVSCALTTQGLAVADLTAEAFLHYACTTRQAGLASYFYAVYVGHLAWQVLHETGHFPPSTPSTLRAVLRGPQLTATELVDQYHVRIPGVRELLIAMSSGAGMTWTTPRCTRWPVS